MEKNHNKPLTVSSEGNTWVICNSKTYAGQKYYFDTSTGQSVWNLCPAEIEKAKMFTKGMPNDEIKKCPEPQDPPMVSQHPRNSQDYNKQIINKRFPAQIPNIYPVKVLDELPGSSGLDDNLWTPNDVALKKRPVYLVTYPQPINMQCSQEFSQNLAINSQEFFYSQDFERSYQSSGFQGNGVHRRKRKHNNWSATSQIKSQHIQDLKNNHTDLRQKLTRKRISQSCEPDYCDDMPREEQDTDSEPNKVFNIQEEYPSKYNLSVLNNLKSSNSKAEHWFIVIDSEITLNNFPFLNKLTDPDKNCYLMVPDHVMTELQDIANSSSDVCTRRMYRFLSEQIDSELAFRGEDMSELASDVIEKTFTTCVQLAAQNNVILLSNDLKFNKYKNQNANIHVLTMKELKTMLESEPMNKSLIEKDFSSYNIKVTVRANKQNKTPGVPVTPTDANKEHSIQVETDSSSSTLLLDAGVPARNSPNHLNEIGLDPVPLNTPGAVISEKGSGNSHSSNNATQRRIKLTRTLPNRNVNNEKTTQKKQYRWRKQRRNTKNIINMPKLSSGIHEMIIDNNAKSNKADTVVNTYKSPNINVTETQQKLISPPTQSSNRRSQFKKTGQNIVINETSTSGVISNTNDSESINSNSHNKDRKNVTMCKHVIFEIAGQSMEEVLRIKREEWVLRFFQIMEEVLRVKLRENSQSKDYAEPWATDLPELTRCIIKEFSDYFNVVDAANKLSFTLYRLCDDKGNVTRNIEPSQYMDMYSYGVYLIAALKDVTNHCEDLNTADESLKKLLYDIQNTNFDSSHNDTFIDELDESAVNISESIGVDKELPQLDATSTKDTTGNGQIDTKSNKKPCRQLSQKRKQTQNKYDEQGGKFFTNVEEAFFSSLELGKRNALKPFVFGDTVDGSPKSANAVNGSTAVQPSSKIQQSSKSLHIPKFPLSPKLARFQNQQLYTTSLRSPVEQLEQQTSRSQDMPSVKDNGNDAEKNTATVEPVVVRNFTRIPDFFNKWDRFDSEKDETEEYLNEYYNETECPPEHYGENEQEDGEITDEADGAEGIPYIERNSEEYNKENQKKFRLFIKDFICEIRETFVAVKKLCDEFVEDLKNSRGCGPEMRTKLKEARATLLNMSNSLNSILDRESTNPENNLLSLLKMAKLEDFMPDEELRLEYTDIVTRCGNQALNYYNNVTIITKLLEYENSALLLYL